MDDRRDYWFSSSKDRYPQTSMGLIERTPLEMNRPRDELGGSRSSGLKRSSGYGPLSEDPYEKRMRLDDSIPLDKFSHYGDKGPSFFSQSSLPDNYKEHVGDYDRRRDYSHRDNFRNPPTTVDPKMEKYYDVGDSVFNKDSISRHSSDEFKRVNYSEEKDLSPKDYVRLPKDYYMANDKYGRSSHPDSRFDRDQYLSQDTRVHPSSRGTDVSYLGIKNYPIDDNYFKARNNYQPYGQFDDVRQSSHDRSKCYDVPPESHRDVRRDYDQILSYSGPTNDNRKSAYLPMDLKEKGDYYSKEDIVVPSPPSISSGGLGVSDIPLSEVLISIIKTKEENIKRTNFPESDFHHGDKSDDFNLAKKFDRSNVGGRGSRDSWNLAPPENVKICVTSSSKIADGSSKVEFRQETYRSIVYRDESQKYPGCESYRGSRERDNFDQPKNTTAYENYEGHSRDGFGTPKYGSGLAITDRPHNIADTIYDRPVTHVKSGNDGGFGRDEPLINKGLGRDNRPGPNTLYERDDRFGINKSFGRGDMPGLNRAYEIHDRAEFDRGLRRDDCPGLVRSFRGGDMPQINEAFERDIQQEIYRGGRRYDEPGINKGLERDLGTGNDELLKRDSVLGIERGVRRDGGPGFNRGLGRGLGPGNVELLKRDSVVGIESSFRGGGGGTGIERGVRRDGGPEFNRGLERGLGPGNDELLKRDNVVGIESYYRGGDGRGIERGVRRDGGPGFNRGLERGLGPGNDVLLERDDMVGFERYMRRDGGSEVSRGSGRESGNDELLLIREGVSRFSRGVVKDRAPGFYEGQGPNSGIRNDRHFGRVGGHDNDRRRDYGPENVRCLEGDGSIFDKNFVGRDSRPGINKDLRKDHIPGADRDLKKGGRAGDDRSSGRTDFNRPSGSAGSDMRKSIDHGDFNRSKGCSGSDKPINVTTNRQSKNPGPDSKENVIFPWKFFSCGISNNNDNKKKDDVNKSSVLNNEVGDAPPFYSFFPGPFIPFYDSIKGEFILKPSNELSNINNNAKKDILKPEEVKKVDTIKLEDQQKSIGNSGLGLHTKQKECDSVLPASLDKTLSDNGKDGKLNTDKCQPVKHTPTTASSQDDILTLQKVKDIDGPCGKDLVIILKNMENPLQSIERTKAQMKKKYLLLNNYNQDSKKWVAKIFINNVEIACESAPMRIDARDAAAKAALEKLREHYYTLLIKCDYYSNGKMVDLDGNFVTINKCPANLLSMPDRSHPSYNHINFAVIPKVKNTMKEYFNSNNVNDLVFSPEFGPQDHRDVRTYAKGMQLTIRKFGATRGRFFLVMSKILKMWDIIKGVIDKDIRYLKQYQLLKPGQKVP